MRASENYWVINGDRNDLVAAGRPEMQEHQDGDQDDKSFYLDD